MKTLLILTLTIAALSKAAAAEYHDIYGTFVTDEGSAKIQIEDCGDETPCGYFVWLNPDIQPKVDVTNKFSGKEGKPLLGSLMLKGFSKKKNDWRGGKVFDSNNDKIYRARLKRLPDGSLQVKGCIGPICQTQVWPESPTP